MCRLSYYLQLVRALVFPTRQEALKWVSLCKCIVPLNDLTPCNCNFSCSVETCLCLTYVSLMSGTRNVFLSMLSVPSSNVCLVCLQLLHANVFMNGHLVIVDSSTCSVCTHSLSLHRSVPCCSVCAHSEWSPSAATYTYGCKFSVWWGDELVPFFCQLIIWSVLRLTLPCANLSQIK